MIETVLHDDICTDYAGPVQRLLTIGETRSYDPAEWLDYAVEFGIRRQHIAKLTRLACDRALSYGDPNSREAWALCTLGAPWGNSSARHRSRHCWAS
jgi:hypothetical protein